MTSFAPSSALVLRRKIRPRRRKSVSTLRLVLPAVALIVGGSIATQAAIRAAQAKAASVVAGAPLRMENPRFTGAMKDGREFLIVATAAVRDKANPNRIALEAPQLTRGYGSDNPTQVVARLGDYDEAKGALLLTGDVQIENGDGYAFKTEKAVIDTRTGQVMGDAGVQGGGAGNQVRADSYSVSDEGDRVIFKGRVRSRLNPGN
ncbi:LPS export ABC transporter periplasmic protein LptC [Caulobacter sp. DWR1-3-2b1]|uniref:LPS export ABC transporter periplasmic protein LptC n=1 Tax=Caulobacter sp. DWR1-3-2b1 TaxID=2804670 RepID=UPI003CED4158